MRKGSGAAIYVRDQLEYVKIHIGINSKIKKQANKGDKVMGVYYKPPDQKDKVDETFYSQACAS